MQIFPEDKDSVPFIDKCLREELPFEYRGFPVNFSGKSYDATQRMEKTDKKPINHLIEICGIADYFRNKYSMNKTCGFFLRDWLAFNDQELLELTSGEVYHDGLEKLNRMREELSFYPADIWKLRMAILWEYIWNKEAFIGRSIAVDDFTGLKIQAGRLVNYCIKLLFYLEGKYIPYSKWFGSVFKNLAVYREAGPLADDALAENNPKKIEEKLCRLYAFVIGRHNKNAGLPRLSNTIRDFFNRPYRVIFAENIIKDLIKSIEDENVKKTDLQKYAYDIITDH